MRPILAILILVYLLTADGSGSVHKCVHCKNHENFEAICFWTDDEILIQPARN